jgi:hypothetical protein
MPGSPPTRIAEAGTSPPPSTRSSSASPVPVRGGGAVSPRSPVSGTARPRLPPSAPRPGAGPSGTSSTSVFQAPQASQRPAHFGWVAPQAEQVKAQRFQHRGEQGKAGDDQRQRDVGPPQPSATR